jgi:hypothetical protein
MPDVKPAFVDDNPIMAGAFAGFMDWLWRQDGAHEQFCAETGHTPWIASKSGLDALILKATGFEEKYTAAFVEWAIKTHWGEADATPIQAGDGNGN